MYTQLAFDLALKIPGEQRSILQNEGWIDVSDIARGVGFTSVVQASNGLKEALHSGQNEEDGDYDQRLYDALWLAHFKLSLDPSQSATFNFTVVGKDGTTEKVSEIGSRLRVEVQKHVVWLGLMEDFRNEKWILF
jgi:hypothetical protein